MLILEAILINTKSLVVPDMLIDMHHNLNTRHMCWWPWTSNSTLPLS